MLMVLMIMIITMEVCGFVSMMMQTVNTMKIKGGVIDNIDYAEYIFKFSVFSLMDGCIILLQLYAARINDIQPMHIVFIIFYLILLIGLTINNNDMIKMKNNTINEK